MVEFDLVTWAASQGIAAVFAIVVLYMLRDMIIQLNQNYQKLTDAIIKCAETKGLNEPKS